MERLIDKYLPADYHDTFVLKSRKPAEQIIPKELINLNPAQARSEKENTLVKQDNKTASPAFPALLYLNTE